MRRRSWALAIAGALALGPSGGCTFGPKVLERSHGKYGESVRLVEEEQLLRNLVHMRYNEMPLALHVSSIAAQYELNGGAEARPFFVAPNPSNSNIIFRTFTSILPDVSVSGANRPTITLVPSDRGESIQRFLTPISAETLVFLGQSSWPVSTVLRLWVERLNGVPNAPSASGPSRGDVPDFARFRRVADLFQEAQDRGLGSVVAEERPVDVGNPLPGAMVTASAAVAAAKDGLEFRAVGDGTRQILTRKQPILVLEINPEAVADPDILELEGLLNLRPGRRRYEIKVATGPLPDPLRSPVPPADALSVTPRSTSQTYFFLANGVEVPCDHLAAGLVRPSLGPDGRAFDERAITAGLFTVHARPGHRPPPEAFVAVKYRDYWYYIDDRDATSKATFALVLQLQRLDFGRQPPAAPFLTLPVGRWRRANVRDLGGRQRPWAVMAFWTCSLTASRLNEAPFCIGGNSMKVSAAFATSCCTKTKRQNS
ncbi:MAG TPA: hypothetical protein VG406_13900 [Isosphaeraceae bacterium]|nr:hypothetical protein [Isosphaeraceae bacterium]